MTYSNFISHVCLHRIEINILHVHVVENTTNTIKLTTNEAKSVWDPSNEYIFCYVHTIWLHLLAQFQYITWDSWTMLVKNKEKIIPFATLSHPQKWLHCCCGPFISFTGMFVSGLCIVMWTEESKLCIRWDLQSVLLYPSWMSEVNTILSLESIEQVKNIYKRVPVQVDRD